MKTQERNQLLLKVLWTGGKYGNFATMNPNETGWRSSWPPVNGSAPKAPPARGKHLLFSVNPASHIRQTNALGEPCAPKDTKVGVLDIAAVNALYAEFDIGMRFQTPEAIENHLYSLPCAPSITWSSGTGIQALWLLDQTFEIASDADRDFIRDVQRQWVHFVGGDTGALDISRMLRLPGSYNVKPDYDTPLPVEYRTFHLNHRYSLADLVKAMGGVKARPEANLAPGATLTDSQIAHRLDIARHGKRGEDFKALFDDGDTSKYGGDQSAADMALMNHLAYWLDRDAAAMEEVFGQSALGHRSKWQKRPDYRMRTIQKALTDVSQTFGDLPAAAEIDALADDAPEKTGSGVRLPQVFSGEELYDKEYPPLRWIADGLIANGHLVVVAGRGKGGKSFLLKQLSKAIDQGGRFLGMKTRPVRVLYIDLEGGGRRFQQRLRQLSWKPENFDVVFELDIITDGGLEQIREFAKSYDLIILDTLARAMMGDKDEKSNQDMAPLIYKISDIAHETDTAIVIIHHTSKGRGDDIFESIRGASAIRNGYDVGIILERKPNEKEALLHVESRDFEGYTITIEQRPGGGWQYLGDAKKLEEVRAGRKAYEALRELGGSATVKELAKELGITEASTGSQLRNLERDGHVKRESKEIEDGTKPPDLWIIV